MPLRRALAEWGIPFGVACMVVAFAAGSAFNPRLKHYALDVRWIVLKSHSTLSASEIATFAARYPNDARPVQNLNGREVLASK